MWYSFSLIRESGESAGFQCSWDIEHNDTTNTDRYRFVIASLSLRERPIGSAAHIREKSSGRSRAAKIEKPWTCTARTSHEISGAGGKTPFDRDGGDDRGDDDGECALRLKVVATDFPPNRFPAATLDIRDFPPRVHERELPRGRTAAAPSTSCYVQQVLL